MVFTALREIQLRSATLEASQNGPASRPCGSGEVVVRLLPPRRILSAYIKSPVAVVVVTAMVAAAARVCVSKGTRTRY